MIQTIHQWQSRFVEGEIFICAKAVEDHTDKLTTKELDTIVSSVAIRRQTYSTGRLCAKTALREMGIDHRDNVDGLLRKEDGSVTWPESAVGSISHTNHWAIAAAAKSGRDYLSLGVDIEQIDRVDQNVLRHIATDEECARLDSHSKVPWGRAALFSIKESLYKCLRPLYGDFFGFKDVQIGHLDAPCIKPAQTDQTEMQPEFYSPSIQLLSPSLAQRFDEQRLRVRLAVLPQHVLSLVTYHSKKG